MRNSLIVRRLPLDDEYAGRESADDMAAAEGFAPHRRREFLAWRAIVRSELGRDVTISYDENGAPQVDCGAHIGVSHSRSMVAVCIGDAPCAVDIESLGRNFGRISRRYISDDEAALSDDPRLPAALWCAKETLYKLAGERSLDFLNDLRIKSVDFASGRICGSVRGVDVMLRMEQTGDHILVCGRLA